ncbi:hypothetical protein HDU86_003875 [Geranomyces michiganensis]|nr:hypothetical protein HDU86_003875 [Geranomyces michiganensis]
MIPVAAGAAPGPVNVALQTPEGERLVDKFAISTTLWDVMRTWEARNQNLNLTNRKGVVERGLLKLKKDVYMMPVCVLMNKEFSTVESLQNTTLQQAGLSSGGGVIRVLLRACDISEMTGSRSGSPAPVPEAVAMPATAGSANSPKPAPEDAADNVPLPIETPEPTAMPKPDPGVTPSEGEPSLPASTLPNVARKAGDVSAPMDIDIEPVRTLPIKDYRANVGHFLEKTEVDPPSMDVDIPQTPDNALPRATDLPDSVGDTTTSVDESSGTVPGTQPEDDSSMKVFHPPPDGVPYNQSELDMSTCFIHREAQM